ncbi:hypothetical protein [Bradyrhizobium cosmicum]|uniref:hypothetical protein n=1 Tax=Bradyrhizobium cosmicum TaxID=1404864 RepID=UPI0028E2A5E4|nr:hypothetical protein [Bradyrhizobium cosmicum]
MNATPLWLSSLTLAAAGGWLAATKQRTRVSIRRAAIGSSVMAGLVPAIHDLL